MTKPKRSLEIIRFNDDEIIDFVAGKGRINARNWNGKGAFAYAKLARGEGEKRSETK